MNTKILFAISAALTVNFAFADTLNNDKEKQENAVVNVEEEIIVNEKSEVTTDKDKEIRFNADEFGMTEKLESGFLTTPLNRAIAKQMNLGDEKGEKPSFGKKVSKFISAPRFGGYFIGTYKYNSSKTENWGDGFNVRLVRLYVDGEILTDFKYRLQLEFQNTPRICDFYLDWCHWKEFGVKIGQFKRCFTFENPMSPLAMGVGDNSESVKGLAGYNDVCGEKSNGGRDLGILAHGDLFPISKDRHSLLHYELGFYNGQGLNSADKNKRKDFIGTLQFQPIKNLFIGMFGWTGNTVLNGQTLERNRWAVGAKYEDEGWTVRAEFMRGKGHQLIENKSTYTFTDDEGKQHTGEDITYSKTDEIMSDGWYVLVGIPCTKWLTTFVKYDALRKYGTNASLKSMYSVCPNFQLHKNLTFQLQYNYIHDKLAAKKKDIHEVWVQTYVRF